MANFFERFFKKPIRVKENENNLIYVASNNSQTKIGKDLVVKPDYVAVVCAKGKVADVFKEGDYRLDTNNMPLLSRMLHLTKPNKKGELPKSFWADFYFVYLKKITGQTFSSYNYIIAKSKDYKKVRVRIEGEFDFVIINPVDFLESMFMQYGAINDKIAKSEIADFVAELCVKKIQKNKPEVESLHDRDSECFEGLIDYVNDELYDCGIKLTKIEITNTIFPKKIFKKVNLESDEIEEANKKRDVVTEVDMAGQIENPTATKLNSQQPDDFAEVDKYSNFESAETSGFRKGYTNKPESDFDKLRKRLNELNMLNAQTPENKPVERAQDESRETTLANAETNSRSGHNQNANYSNLNNENFNFNINQDSIDEITKSGLPFDEKNADIYNIEQTAGENLLPEFDTDNLYQSESEEIIQKTITYKKCANCGAFNPIGARTCFLCKAEFE